MTEHVLNDVLRLRMADAGADVYYGHEEVGRVEALVKVIVGSRRDPSSSSPRPDQRRTPQPEAALDWVQDQGYDTAFDGGPQKSLGLSRRAVTRIRRKVAAHGGLGSPGQTPSWKAVSRFVNRARGADLDWPGPGEGS